MPGLYFEPDIRKTPFWLAATPETRARLIATAKTYVGQAREDANEFVGTNLFHYPSAAGLSALMLLYHENRAAFNSLPAETWARWPHIVLDYPNAGHDGVWAEMLTACYRKAPGALRLAVENLLRSQLQNTHQAGVLWQIQSVWDEPLSGRVFGVVSEEPCSEAVLTQALDLLLQQGHKPARDWCMNLISEAVTTGETGDTRLNSAVSGLLLNRTTRDEWTILWSLLSKPSHQDFAFRMLCQERHRRAIVSDQLSEPQLADLYIWLGHNAPAVPKHQGVYSPGLAEKLDDVKREVLNVLMHRGTPAVVEQCERIYGELKQDWFRRAIIEAKAQTRRTGWGPIKPMHLWRYMVKEKCRLVRNERELCEAVMAALERINQELQGENPSAPDLWDGNKPKDERHLSNWLTRQLKCLIEIEGVFIGREVAVNVRGQTDIQVITKPLADEPEFGVIIEVKGCWNPEVNTDMDQQLLGKYLANHSFTHGIYVVGWYYCAAWNDGSDRRRLTHTQQFRDHTRDEAQKVFSKQAEDLSSNTKTIRSFVLDARLP